MSVAPGQSIGRPDDLFATANGKSDLSGKPYTVATLAEFNRLRSNVKAATDPMPLGVISGPWPLTPPGYGGFNSGNDTRDIDFYYPDTGNAESLSLVWTGLISSNDPSLPTRPTSFTAQIIIGGDQPVRFQGQFQVIHISSATDPHANGSTNFPGNVVFTQTGANNSFALTSQVLDVTVGPGIYTFNFNCDAGSFFTNPYVILLNTGSVSISLTTSNALEVPGVHDGKRIFKLIGPKSDPTLKYPFGIFSWSFNFSLQTWMWQNGGTTSYQATTTGIFFGKSRMINSLGLQLTTSMPWNIGTWPYSRPYETHNTPPQWLGNASLPKGWQILDSNGNLQTITTAGKTAVSPPNPYVPGLAPGPGYWGINVGDTVVDGTVTWTLTRKNNRIPTNWKANHVYKIGDVIIDSNGNDQEARSWRPGVNYTVGQIVVDANNAVQSCSAPGISGGAEPAWNTVLNGFTTDNSVTWKLVSTAPGALLSGAIIPTSWPATPYGAYTQDGVIWWRLKKVYQGMSPARARMYSIPRYPWFKSTDSAPSLSGFQPAGFWIYRVNLNRLGSANASGIVTKTPGEVSVTLGCIRNGVFVSFGTWSTGQAIDAMWPIFTNTALCYQCSEAVDVQASIISCGTNFTTGGAVTYPICAAYYNDLEACLALLT